MKPWTWRHAIIKSPLPPTTRHVLLTLSCHLNDLGEDCFPSTAMLATETGLTERSVCTHLALAAEQGWFVVRKHGYGKQKWARHEYFPRIPEGFELPDREQGTEGRSVPSKKGLNKKALKDVQCPVDKGTEAGSVPSEKALNVVPEGTEPNDRKALKEVQSNTAVNPSNKAAAREAENDAAAAAQKISTSTPGPERELSDFLVALERARGKSLSINRTRDRVHVLTWVGNGVTLDRLREAHSLAVAARTRDGDERPTYVGFIATFFDAGSSQGSAPTVTEWWLDGPATEAHGPTLGLRAKNLEESLPHYRVLVAKAAGKGPWIDFVLKHAEQTRSPKFYEWVRAEIGPALLPVDDYPS